MLQYLNLLFDVVHVLGARNSAIYDLRRRRIFSLDEDATNLLKSLLDGKPLDEVVSARPDFRQLIIYLQKNSLAQIEETHRDHNEHLKEQYIEQEFQTAWIELGNSCNHKCIHCYNYSGPTPFTSQTLNLESLKNAIRDLHLLGTKNIKFIGGEPLALKHEVKDLVRFANEHRFASMAIHTNGTLITKDWVDFFKTYRITVDVTVYGHTSELHEAVTKTLGSFNKTIDGLNLLNANDCSSSINMIVMPHNEQALPESRRFFRNKYPHLPFAYDYIRPSGRGDKLYEQLQFKYLNRYNEHDSFFNGVSREEFMARRKYNPCLKDKITITSSGDVFPCIMTRETTGNINTHSLASVVSSHAFRSFRELPLDAVEICRDCEYRYACTDCRPIPIGLGMGKYSKPPECKYNPYTGRVESNLVQLRRNSNGTHR